MSVEEIMVTKIDHAISPNEKKVIYDFGEDIEEYRYLVEDWKKDRYGKWHRQHMYWPHVHTLAELVL